MTSIIPSKEKIDIVCPIIEKDIPKLSLCLLTWKQYVYPLIEEIFLVGPDSLKIKLFAKENKLIYINENDYLKCSNELLLPIREDRRGWIKLLLIKLTGELGQNNNTLVIDADVFFNRNHTFLDLNEIPHFYMNTGCWKKALDIASKLLGMSPNTLLSYVSDKMIFNKNVLKEIQTKIEIVTGKEWKEAIISNYDNSTNIGFSEFELYGMYYGVQGIEETTHLIRVGWNDAMTLSTLKNKYFIYDLITFE